MRLLSAFEFASLISIALCLSACTKKSAPVADLTTPAALVERGRQIYKLNCIACHNPNPTVDGALGPAIGGSSLELLTARVLKATYPDGYKAKRDTKTMPAFPQLEAELPALQAYLAAP